MKKIRLAKVRDVNKIFQLYQKEQFLRGEKNIGYSLKNIKEYVNNKKNKMFIYKIKNKIVGALLAEFHCDYIFLHTMAVDPVFRREGVATSLLKHLEDEMKKKKLGLIEAFTDVRNSAMKKLLKNSGYKKGKKFYYYFKEV